MEFLGGLRNAFALVRQEVRRRNEEADARLRQREIDETRQMITHMHTFTETAVGALSMDLSGMRRRMYPNASLHFAKSIEEIALAGFVVSADESNEQFEEKLLADLPVGEEERKTIRVDALTQARNYWEEQLKNPDLAFSERMIGRRRLTRLSSRLEMLTQDHQPPQQS